MEGNGRVSLELSGLFERHNAIDGASNTKAREQFHSIAYIKSGLMQSSLCSFPGPLEPRPGLTASNSHV